MNNLLSDLSQRLGAHAVAGGCRFGLWAPFAKRVDVISEDNRTVVPMKLTGDGIFSIMTARFCRGDRYYYLLNGSAKRPDPCSLYQPKGVHGPSQVVVPPKSAGSQFTGTLKGKIIYELHVGTFTAEGTLNAACKKIPYLKKIGVECIELMPLAQFTGKYNWGYDGVYPFALHESYGTHADLLAFVESAHRSGILVCLDYVMNHLGPEGNYLRDFGPYFTDRFNTPWGEAVNFGGDRTGFVKHYFVSAAIYWLKTYRFDGLRLDATHAIYDKKTGHVLKMLSDAVGNLSKQTGRRLSLIAEDDRNLSSLVAPLSKGGYGMTAQWSDDFHHAVHRKLTNEKSGYYIDYGAKDCIADAMLNTHIYRGQYSGFRQKNYGQKVTRYSPANFVINLQNHDQVGNRPFGDRSLSRLPLDIQKCAATLLLMNPHTPLIFMGQEYGEKRGFKYFTDHSDKNLIHAVRQGRKAEFSSFGWRRVADPQSKHSFIQSKLNWQSTAKGIHKNLLSYYRRLIALRKQYDIAEVPRRNVAAFQSSPGLIVWQMGIADRKRLICAVNLSDKYLKIPINVNWAGVEVVLSSSDAEYGRYRKNGCKLPQISPRSALILYI